MARRRSRSTKASWTSAAGASPSSGPGAGLLTIQGLRNDRIFQVNPGITASISGLTLTGGSSANGGGAVYVQGRATLANCMISGSTAINGGGIYSNGTLTMTGCTIGGDSATNGGALWNNGTATLTGCTISDNSAYLGGGLNDDKYGLLNLTGCTISGNSAEFGGGLTNYGVSALAGCTISGNSAYLGGGLNDYKYGHLNLTDCTISGNSAELGGGLANYGRSALTACTVSGNTAVNTIYNPAANPGGGIYNYSNYYGGETILVDTIVAGNSGPGIAASDIGGNDALSVIGTNDLIGTGGYGGVYNGTDGDIVLTGLAGWAWPRWGTTAGRPRPCPCCPEAPPSATAPRSSG